MPAISRDLAAEQALHDEVAILQSFVSQHVAAALNDQSLGVVLKAVELRIDALRARIARFAAAREGRVDDFCG